MSKEWYGKPLEEGEVRTVLIVVVKSDRPWTALEVEGCLWDGHHGKEATKTDFHVTREATWGPMSGGLPVTEAKRLAD